MALRSWKFGLAAGLACGLAASAQAGLLPLSATAVPDGDNFRYTYGVMLTSNSTLQIGRHVRHLRLQRSDGRDRTTSRPGSTSSP